MYIIDYISIFLFKETIFTNGLLLVEARLFKGYFIEDSGL